MNLRQLAAHPGLSPTTVSRALNGYPEVGAATRARVAEAAHRHHYRPNTRAKGLATGRAMAIGHVIPTRSRHEIVNPIFADFISGAGERYAAAGYDLLLSVVPDADEARAYRDLKARGTVDGLIVHAPRAEDARIALLHEIGLPFVVHGRSTGAALPYSRVDVNNLRAFRRATEFLIDLGHRRIALVNGLEAMDFALRRRQGYLQALETRGIAADPALMTSGEMTETNGYRAGRAMLAAPDPPTAAVVSSIIMAIGLRRAAEERGLKLGRDVSVVTHDDDLSYLRNGEDDVPMFTATRSSVREAGRIAAEMLLERIRSPGQAPATRLLRAGLVLGQSTGPAPRGARSG